MEYLKIIYIFLVLTFFSCVEKEYFVEEVYTYPDLELKLDTIYQEVSSLAGELEDVDLSDLEVVLTQMGGVESELDSISFEIDSLYVKQEIQDDVLLNYQEYIEEIRLELESVKLGMLSIQNNIIRVYDFFNQSKSHSDIIDEVISFSSVLKDKVIVFDTIDWSIDRAIEIPSNTTVLIDGVTIKQNDYVFDNVFRGDNLVLDPNNLNGFPITISPIENIRVLGVNGAEIIGCDINQTIYNSFLNETQELVGDFYGWRTLQMSFSNCTNLEISGLKFTQTRGWCISTDSSSQIKIHDLEIYSDVKNGDGVDIREGCHDFQIYNISGETSDDMVALSAISSIVDFSNSKYMYPIVPTSMLLLNLSDVESGITNGSIQNVKKSGAYHAVVLYTGGGRKIQNIYVNDIEETVYRTRNALVSFYSDSAWGYNDNDINNISINNVKGIGNFHTAAVYVSVKVDNVWLNNISSNDGKTYFSEYDVGLTITNTESYTEEISTIEN